MRLWSLHPQYLDRQGLLALWREALLAQKVLNGQTTGYRNHPQLDRFKEHSHPRKAIAVYLRAVWKEAKKRGYDFDLGKIKAGRTRKKIQTLMYLKLSVAGHLTIFLTRTRGPFWSHRPALILWVAVLGTQILATLIAVYGLFMMPLGWGWAGFVWGYALVWFLLNDRLKLLAYRIFDPVKIKISSDMTPQIAKRAYEIYEQHGHRDGQAPRDWLEAEGEIRKK